MNFSEMDDSKKKILIFAGIGAGVFLLLIIIVTAVALGNQGGEQTAEGTEEQAPQSASSDSSESPPRQGIPGIPEDDLKEAEEATDEAQISDVPGTEKRLPLHERVIATVGEEDIYAADIQAILKYYDEAEQEEKYEEALNHLIEQSVILQGGAAEGYITLSNDVFNTPSKDRGKREDLVEEVRTSVGQDADFISADVITIWYKNQGDVAAMGLEEGQQFAKRTIDKLQEDVQAGTITMEEAEKLIQNYDKLEDLDINYQNNALFQLSGNRGSSLTGIQELHDIIWSLEKGEVSDVYLVNPDDLDVSLFYAFAYVIEKRESKEGVTNFEDWYEKKTTQYPAEIR